jgi:hypothetical protein
MGSNLRLNIKNNVQYLPDCCVIGSPLFKFEALLLTATVEVIVNYLLHGDTSMKIKSIALLMGALAFSLSLSAIAGEHHTAQALEHSAMATAHGQDGHADQLLKHAEEGLKHAEAAEQEHAEAHKHMTEAVKHLKMAIDHAKQKHADIATQHAEEAMTHMRQSIGQ